MTSGEFAFVALIIAGFFLVVSVKGLVETLLDRLFDRSRVPFNARDVMKAMVVSVIALSVCLIAWSYL